MAKVYVNGNWRLYWGPSPLPAGMVAMGVVIMANGESGALLAGLMDRWYLGCAGALRGIDMSEMKTAVVADLTKGARTRMKFMEQIEVAFRAKVGTLWIKTREEVRATGLLVNVAESLNYADVMVWSVTRGLTSFADKSAMDGSTRDPRAIVSKVSSLPGRQVVALMDFAPWLNDPTIRRMMVEMNRTVQTLGRDEAKQVVVVDQNDPPPGVPVTVLEMPLPDREEMGEILDSILEFAPEGVRKDVAKNGNRDHLIGAALGLTADDAMNAFARSQAKEGRYVPELIAKEKARLVRGTGLEWYDPDPRGLKAIGGLDKLKGWLEAWSETFGEEAREYGLPFPKGIMLLGIPGGGKSLTSKAVATAWKMPLLRLDVGALFGKYVGDSEAKVRLALSTAEAVSPCVLWVDEIEKAFGGQGGGESDGGTSSRVFGTFLTWMQERKPGVFVLATSNDVSALPPEFLRAGRWDAMWYVDLPTAEERVDIAKVMCGKFPHCGGVDCKVVAAHTDGFTGAEVEQCFVEALHEAFADGARPVTTKDVVAATADIVPLSKTMSEKIEALRKWAKGRARCATAPEAKGGKKAVRTIE